MGKNANFLEKHPLRILVEQWLEAMPETPDLFLKDVMFRMNENKSRYILQGGCVISETTYDI